MTRAIALSGVAPVRLRLPKLPPLSDAADDVVRNAVGELEYHLSTHGEINRRYAAMLLRQALREVEG